MYNSFRQILRWTNKVTEILVGLFCFLIIFPMIAQVVWRYAIGNALAWAEELARISFVWCVFLAAVIGVKSKAHIKMESLLRKLSKKSRAITEVIVYLMIAVILFFVLIYGIRLTDTVQDSHTTGLKISLSYMYLPIPLSCILMILNIIDLIVNDIKVVFSSNSNNKRGEISC